MSLNTPMATTAAALGFYGLPPHHQHHLHVSPHHHHHHPGGPPAGHGTTSPGGLTLHQPGLVGGAHPLSSVHGPLSSSPYPAQQPPHHGGLYSVSPPAHPNHPQASRGSFMIADILGSGGSSTNKRSSATPTSSPSSPTSSTAAPDSPRSSRERPRTPPRDERGLSLHPHRAPSRERRLSSGSPPPSDRPSSSSHRCRSSPLPPHPPPASSHHHAPHTSPSPALPPVSHPHHPHHPHHLLSPQHHPGEGLTRPTPLHPAAMPVSSALTVPTYYPRPTATVYDPATLSALQAAAAAAAVGAGGPYHHVGGPGGAGLPPAAYTTGLPGGLYSMPYGRPEYAFFDHRHVAFAKGNNIQHYLLPIISK